MKLNFDEIPDADDFSPLTPGKYPMRVIEVRDGASKAGDPMWTLVMEVTSGDRQGKRVYDSILFKAGGAMKRAKLVLGRLGVDTHGEVEIEPSMLMDAEAIVTVGVESYEKTEDTGEQVTRERNKVPFAGYEPFDPATAAGLSGGSGGDPKDGVPF